MRLVMASANNKDGSNNPGTHNPVEIPHILPHEKVFPIQIGSELFRLSGASISSDDGAQIRTLYIDRDPVTFADISRHLQGYYVQPRDGAHFVKLFADAQFYQLPKLIAQLFEECIYVSIGGREFKVNKDIFSNPGDSPNYFTLGFAFLFSSGDEIFPGLEREGLLRPPSIVPPSIPNRSADIFGELLHLMRGYPIHIRDEEHRAGLLRDCKYFLFKGLEQKLIPHNISYNNARLRDEITIRLEDIRQPGLSVATETSSPEKFDSGKAAAGWVNYRRPFVDDKPYELLIEIGNDCTRLNIQTMRAEFFGDAKRRMARLYEVVASKLELPDTPSTGLPSASVETTSHSMSVDKATLIGEQVKFEFDNPGVTLDGVPWHQDPAAIFVEESEDESDETAKELQPQRKRRRIETQLKTVLSISSDVRSAEKRFWTVKTGQWRLRVQNANDGEGKVECVLVAVKIDAIASELARNEQRSFLGS